jgi:hypothetical protein
MTKQNHINRSCLGPPLALALGVALGIGSSARLPAQQAATGAASPADAPVELKVKWPVGQRCLQRLEMSQDQQISSPSLPEPVKQRIVHSQDVALTVAKEREDGGREVELAITATKMEITGGQTTMSFDSKSDPAKDSDNQLAPLFRKLGEMRLKLFTNRKGAVEKVEGLKEFADKLSSDLPPALQGMLQGMLNEDNIKHMGAIPEGLPDKPVKIGERWPLKQEISLGPMGKFTITLQITFKGWENRDQRRCAVLEHIGTIASPPGAGAAGGQMAMTITGGDTKGRTWFDPELGMPIESTAEQKMSMKVSAMGQDMSIQMQQMVTNRLVEVTKTAK